MSIKFDSSVKYIRCSSDAPVTNVFSAGGSLSWWSRTSVASTAVGERVFSIQKDEASSAGWYVNYYDGIVPRAFVFTFRRPAGTGVWRSSSNAFSTGIWQHFALSYDADSTANNPILYINGSSVSVTRTLAPDGAAGDDTISRITIGNSLFEGEIEMEDTRIFNQIISAQEVALLAAGYRGPIGDEVLWLDMEGYDSQALSSDYASVIDKTINKNNGTPQGAPIYRASIAERYG